MADSQSRRQIDLAIGVLVAWRRCSPQAAFEELAQSVRETGIGLSGLSKAIVDFACDADQPDMLRSIARRRWGHLAPQRTILAAHEIEMFARTWESALRPDT